MLKELTFGLKYIFCFIICKNAACGNQRLTIKHCLHDNPQWKDSRKKHNIQGDFRTLLEKDCELGNIMRFLKGLGIFEKYRLDRRLQDIGTLKAVYLVIDDFDAG